MTITPFIRLATLALFAWNAAVFTRALRCNFTRPDGVPLLMRWLAFCGAAAIVLDGWLLAVVEMKWIWSVTGLVLLALAQIIFRAAVRATSLHKLSLAFSTNAPAHLNTAGIYAHVRHPFYLAYSLNWLGAAVATLHWSAGTMLGVMGVFYLTAAVREERKFLSSPLRVDYLRYRRSTGIFLPKFSAITRTNQKQGNP
jgi:protein-S-isoprenylcysteine O-methyltransferase Ste14